MNKTDLIWLDTTAKPKGVTKDCWNDHFISQLAGNKLTVVQVINSSKNITLMATVLRKCLEICTTCTYLRGRRVIITIHHLYMDVHFGVTHISDAWEHAENMTNNIVLTHIDLDIDYKAGDLWIKFTYCWMFVYFCVCVCKRKRKKDGQWMNENKREKSIFLLREKQDYSFWPDVVQFESFCGINCLWNLRSPFRYNWSLEAEKRGNNVIWLYKLPLEAIRCHYHILCCTLLMTRTGAISVQFYY